jgi:hypothetical protein
MWYNPYLYDYYWFPRIPSICEKPPTLYAIMNSIVNYGKEDKEKIKDLAKYARTEIFDFDYPLTDNISKEDFECMILNKFMMRRIGFETMTAFKIQLNVKLNEIMPLYNKMFDLIYEEKLFGDITIKDGTDNRKTVTENQMKNTAENDTTSDLRYSKMPQGKLNNVRNGDYVTDYNYNTVNSKDNSESKGNTTGTDDNISHETTQKINMVDILEKFNKEIKNVYSLIFKDIEELFYGLE